MVSSIKKRGQKIIKKFSRASIKASEEGKEHIKKNFIKRISHIENIRLLVLEWVLLVGALILLSLAQAFWFGDSYAENAFTSGGTYTEATLGDVNSLNPLFATTSSEKVLSRLLFSTISTIDYSGHVGIGLAESIRAGEGGKTWVVKLRDGLKWSDGEPITNKDVLFTVKLIQDPTVNTIYSANLSNVKVSENESGEIIFNLPTAYADFISALNIPLVPEHILGNADPKTLVENSFSTSPVTSGAFTFNAMQVSAGGDKVYYLSSNPEYYMGKTLLNSFAVHVYEAKDEIVQAINAGSVTATAELSALDAILMSAGQFNQKDSSLNSGAFIFFNMARTNIKNQELRAAIRQGIDMERIRGAAPGTLSLDYPIMNSQINIKNYPQIPARDYEAAKAKIAELSPDQPIHIDIATVNSGYLPGVAEAIRSEMEGLGLEATVTTYEENQDFINNIISKRNYDVLVYEIELGADPDLLPYYHSSQATTTGLNLSNYRNALVDDLLLGARDTLDEELRVKKYESFLERWVTGVPAIGLYQPNLTYLYNKNVRTFGNDVRLVTALDRFSDITNWAVNKTTKNKTP
ncbi:hypothetical protein IJG89_01295 [Candidatus Saccharibacteria bacterium]|nr:hypothetical protein [Candidatus Saccharibacteria bacterium]